MKENAWFAGRSARQAPPAEAVKDCTRAGRCDQAVAYWIQRLNFDGPAWLIRDHLAGLGAWDRAELCDHQANRSRLFWSWCCQIAETGDTSLYLMR